MILLTLVALLGKDLLRGLSLWAVPSQAVKGKYLDMLFPFSLFLFSTSDPQKENPNYTLYIISQFIHI